MRQEEIDPLLRRFREKEHYSPPIVANCRQHPAIGRLIIRGENCIITSVKQRV